MVTVSQKSPGHKYMSSEFIGFMGLNYIQLCMRGGLGANLGNIPIQGARARAWLGSIIGGLHIASTRSQL